MPPIVTLTTDFGNADGYVGQMKGVLLSVCPEARLVDLSHDVPPQDVPSGAFLLETALAAFPAGTVHLGVVDPGVGTGRRRLAVRTARHTFVLPDNGLVSRVLEREPLAGAWAIEAAAYLRPCVCPTFEGRDAFAPAAAWLARGVPPELLGPPVPDPVRLPRTPGRVLWVDRFGNVVLDVRREELPAGRVAVRTPRHAIDVLARTYGEAEPGRPVLLFGSSGYLEIAVPGGRADAAVGLAVGDTVAVVL